ncbi:chloride channel, partial [Melampsora americana]
MKSTQHQYQSEEVNQDEERLTISSLSSSSSIQTDHQEEQQPIIPTSPKSQLSFHHQTLNHSKRPQLQSGQKRHSYAGSRNRFRKQQSFSRLSDHPPQHQSTSNRFNHFLTSSTSTSHLHQERKSIISNPSNYDSIPTQSDSRLSNYRTSNLTFNQSLRIPDWLSVYSNSQSPKSRPPSISINRKAGYDAEFKDELAGQSGNGMRVWYDTYTSVDWLHEHVKQSIRRKNLDKIRGLRGQLRRTWDRSQGWFLVTLIGIATALMAGLIVTLEMWLFDLKEGYCASGWMTPKRFCCAPPSPAPTTNSTLPASFISSSPFNTFSAQPTLRSSPFTSNSFIQTWSTPLPTTSSCPNWILWTDVLSSDLSPAHRGFAGYFVYLLIAICFAGLSSLMTVYLSSSQSVYSAKDRAPTPSIPFFSKTHRTSKSSYHNHDHHESVEHSPERHQQSSSSSPFNNESDDTYIPDEPPVTVPRVHKVAYFAAGSGIPEIKCILSGFVIRGYLGSWTLFTKSFGLALSVASGLSLGKEGPLVHIASCIGNIFTRWFQKFDRNEAKRREVLSAACAAGVSVAFGAPIGGVLFSLEEVSYFFPPRVMWRSCWCALVAAATLRVLDPFKTGKTVLFEVTYDRQWHFFELIGFILLGIVGGVLGAWFAQINFWWTQNVRKKTWLQFHPIAEVLIVTLVTVLLGFSNQYLRMGGSELVYEMIAECKRDESKDWCINDPSKTGSLILALTITMILKFLLTIVTFGIKCPAGIFIPSLSIGAMLGRILGFIVEYAFYLFPNFGLFHQCLIDQTEGFGKACVLPGVWSMVGSAAMLAGVTRSTVSLVVIVMELTGSLVHILPIAISVLVAKTTADAIESRSIYDLVIEASDLPYLDAKSSHIHSAMPSDIMDTEAIIICLEDGLKISEIRKKIQLLSCSSSAGGFPLVSKDEIGEERIIGYIGRSELEHGISLISERILKLNPTVKFQSDKEVVDSDFVVEEEDGLIGSRIEEEAEEEMEEEEEEEEEVDLSYLVDHAPVTVSVKSPMELLHEMFVRLGVRYLVIQDERGLYLGIIERNR